MRLTAARVTTKALLYLVLTVGAALCFLPVFWLVRSSVMTLGDIFKFPPILWPAHIRWQNFAEAMQASPFLLYFRNTMIVVVPNVVGLAPHGEHVGVRARRGSASRCAISGLRWSSARSSFRPRWC